MWYNSDIGLLTLSLVSRWLRIEQLVWLTKPHAANHPGMVVHSRLDKSHAFTANQILQRWRSLHIQQSILYCWFTELDLASYQRFRPVLTAETDPQIQTLALRILGNSVHYQSNFQVCLETNIVNHIHPINFFQHSAFQRGRTHS